MEDILYPAGLYRTHWLEDEYGKHPSFKYLIMSADVEGVKCYDVATMYKTIKDMNRLGIRSPGILYEGFHLPEGNTSNIRRRDFRSPHLIRIIKDIRDWPMGAVINFLSRKISQETLEAAVLGRGDIKDFDFKRIVRCMGFSEAIRRRGRPKQKGKFVPSGAWKRQNVVYAGNMVDWRVPGLREDSRGEILEPDQPPPKNHVWSRRAGQYVHTGSPEGKRVMDALQNVTVRLRDEGVEVPKRSWSRERQRYVSTGVEIDTAQLVKKFAQKRSGWQHSVTAELKIDSIPEFVVDESEEVERADEDISEEEYQQKSYERALRQSLGRELTEQEQQLMKTLDIVIEADEEDEPEEDYFEDVYEDDEEIDF